MEQIAALVIWMAMGVTTSAALRKPGEPRWGWAPIASILGPLWIGVAMERRGRSRPEWRGVPDTLELSDDSEFVAG